MSNKGIKSVRPKTLLKVIKYLEDELGLSVYGPCRDLESGEEKDALMDYTPEDCVRLRELVLKGDIK